jgi:hypothetical protein
VTRSTKQLGAVLAILAMISFTAWPFWKYLYRQAATASLEARAKALVDAHPDLQPAWTIAMLDDILTQSEATIIVEGAGEKVTPNE